MKLDIITYKTGINMLRVGNSPYIGRIEKLIAERVAGLPIELHHLRQVTEHENVAAAVFGTGDAAGTALAAVLASEWPLAIDGGRLRVGPRSH